MPGEVQIVMSADEAKYLSDILQMWMEGIEAEVQGLTEQSDADAHWSKYGLRKQFVAAAQIKLRIDMGGSDGSAETARTL